MKERRGNGRWSDRPVRPGRMGKESCIADAVDAAAHEGEEGQRVQERPEKEKTGQECTERMRRVTGYSTATLISESE